MRMIRKTLLSSLPATGLASTGVAGFLFAFAAIASAEVAATPASEDSPAEDAAPREHVTQSAVWLPALSAFLPGFGQFWHGEPSAWGYTGAALGGVALMFNGLSELVADSAEGFSPNPTEGIEDWSVRKVLLGGLAYQGSGMLSAYSSFRTSVPAFQAEQGKYKFLTGEENLGDIFLSPFRFGHLKKTTSWLPLGALAGVVAFLVAEERSGRDADWVFSADDPVFASLISYNAGVTEEATFRGWILPLAYETLGETWWAANGAQALLFAAAHYSEKNNPVPWPQALMGWYTGYLTRKNGWTLSEAVFVHFWWDAILLNGLYLTLHKAPAAAFRLELPIPL